MKHVTHTFNVSSVFEGTCLETTLSSAPEVGRLVV